MTAREEPQTQSLGLAREELAAVLAGRWFAPHGHDADGEPYGEHVEVSVPLAQHLADALLASPALARVIREREEAAWDEGRRDTRAGWLDPTRYVFNPHRDLAEETL